MNQPIDYIRKIETEFPVDEIKVGGLRVWQFLRNTYAIEFQKLYFDYRLNASNSTSKKIFSIRNIFAQLANSFWQYTNRKRRYKYILFTNVLEERIRMTGTIHQISQGVLEYFKDDILVVLDPVCMRHKTLQNYEHKHYLSQRFFILRYFFERFLSQGSENYYIENETVLKNIAERFGLQVDYRKRIKEFFGLVSIFDAYFKKHQPEAVFVMCYYGLVNQAVIFAAHLYDIKVVELQHGIINEKVYAYNFFRETGRDCLPDYLFAFGDYVKEILDEHFISKKNIISVGNYYIEYIRNTGRDNKEAMDYFQHIREKFDILVAITSETLLEEELIDFIIKAAKLDKRIAYIFIPRMTTKDYTDYVLPENFIVNNKLDFYRTVVFCDYHSTVQSTCALEALALGIQNIFININGYSENLFDNMLEENCFSSYVNSPYEYVEAINSIEYRSTSEVALQGLKFYKANIKDNIACGIKEILNTNLNSRWYNEKNLDT